MDLFKNDDSAEDFYKYKDSRQNFTKENKKMKITLSAKTVDSESIPFDEVHTTIYGEVGLGENWKVNESKKYEEIDKATGGFNTVTTYLEDKVEDREFRSDGVVSKILGIFRKK
jgi:hypothetical protein